MPCKLCGKNVYVLGGPEGYVFYESGSLVHKECHDALKQSVTKKVKT